MICTFFSEIVLFSFIVTDAKFGWSDSSFRIGRIWWFTLFLFQEQVDTLFLEMNKIFHEVSLIITLLYVVGEWTVFINIAQEIAIRRKKICQPKKGILCLLFMAYDEHRRHSCQSSILFSFVSKLRSVSHLILFGSFFLTRSQ